VPNLKSAKKRVKTNEKRRQRNRAAKSILKTNLKRVDELEASNDTETLKIAAQSTLSVIGKSKRKGAINRKRASRLQSRMQRKLNQAAAATVPAASE